MEGERASASAAIQAVMPRRGCPGTIVDLASAVTTNR
jgi:hypothetical protein